MSVPAANYRPMFWDYWLQNLDCSQMVQDTICFGYLPSFVTELSPSFEKNNQSALRDMDFVRAEVKRLEALGCIK